LGEEVEDASAEVERCVAKSQAKSREDLFGLFCFVQLEEHVREHVVRLHFLERMNWEEKN
jgi:hypothetical protein